MPIRVFTGAQYGANFDTPWLKISSARAGGEEFGYVQVGDMRWTTTGVLGLWRDADGSVQRRAFPGWATIPSHYSLAVARIWHLAFAWVLAMGLLLYLGWSLVNGHLRRDIHISRREWRLSHIWQDVKNHARLRFPAGKAALRYNVLQKLAYAGVMFGALPLMILTGLAMSPGTDAWFPSGRRSVRRAAVRAFGAFPVRFCAGRVLCSAHGDGAAGGAVQRSALDDHRALPAAEGEGRVSRILFSRRSLVAGGALGAGSLMLSGCDKLIANRTFRETLESAEDLNKASQRVLGRNALAQEFTASQMSPNFRANGSREVADPAYQAQLASGFSQMDAAARWFGGAATDRAAGRAQSLAPAHPDHPA